MIPSFKQYLVEEEREIYFTYGRMNPPHIGHGRLMNVMSAKAGKTPYMVYLSQSQDARKNPLTYEQKIKHVRKMYPKHARNVILDRGSRTVFDVATKLYEQGFNKINMVVGQDRQTEFEALLNKYNGKKGRHGFYNFENINVMSSGDRDPDADGESGMSATRQRESAKKNDFTTFSQGVPTQMNNRDAKKLFNDVRVGMGLKEVKEFKNKINLEPVSETREKYIEGELFNEGDQVRTRSGDTGTIHRLGTNYVIVDIGDGVRRHWIDDVELIESTKETRWRDLEDLVEKDTFHMIKMFFDRNAHKKKYEKVVRMFLDLRKKNPGKASANLRKVAQMTGGDIRVIDRVLRDMVKAGALPKHLIDYPTLQRENYQLDWGTPEATKKAKKMTPGQDVDEDAVKQAKARIDREKKQDAVRHDSMLDRARLARARRKNRETDPNESKYDRPHPPAGIKSNPVAKNMNRFNKAATHRDRKKDAKRGYQKHKGQLNGGE